MSMMPLKKTKFDDSGQNNSIFLWIIITGFEPPHVVMQPGRGQCGMRLVRSVITRGWHKAAVGKGHQRPLLWPHLGGGGGGPLRQSLLPSLTLFTLSEHPKFETTRPFRPEKGRFVFQCSDTFKHDPIKAITNFMELGTSLVVTDDRLMTVTIA